MDFIPKGFSKLNDGFYSIGNLYFYKKLKEMFPVDQIKLILNSLSDIAVDLNRLDRVLSKDLSVVRTSLLRDYKEEEVRNKLHRMANGGVELTPYNFSFNYSLNKEKSKNLDFKVVPNSLPPTNIHVVIGGNGVGKTTFLNSILREYFEGNAEYSIIYRSNLDILLNLVVVSYSPFDRLFKDIDLHKIHSKYYSYIGLREDPTVHKTESYKNITSTNKDFIIALLKCKFSEVLRKKWLNLIEILEIDGYFANRNLSKLMDDIDTSILKKENFNINPNYG